MFDRLFPALVGVLVLVVLVGVGACAPPGEPAVTPSPSPQPSPSPTEPIESPLPTPPSPLPSPTPEVEPVLDHAVALYAAGTAEDANLYALTDDATTADLDEAVYEWAAVSRHGRWFATSSGAAPAESTLIFDLETENRYVVDVRPDFGVFGMAFDPEATRLAFLELAQPGVEGFPWAIVIVDLEDGSVVRLEGPVDPDSDLLPGNPIGWHGEELLIGTFIPYTDATAEGIWAINVPPGVTAVPVEELEPREVLPGGSYLFQPRYSVEAARLLYLNRDFDYVPDDYEIIGFDLAVNELWVHDLEDGSSELLVEETEGGALGSDIAWSPDGEAGLFAEGQYDGATFAFLDLKAVDSTGSVSEVGQIPLPDNGDLISLNWCSAETALVVVATADRVHELYWMDLETGESSLIASDDVISVIGCVDRADGVD